jgi:rod shape-determining protein MreC
VRGPRLRLLLVLLVLTAFTLTALDARDGSGSPFDVVRRGADTLFGPVQRTVGTAARSVGGALGGLGRIGGYQQDNERLRRENDELRRRLLDDQGAEAARREVADLLKLKDEGSYTTVLARVVGYGAYQPFESTVTLDVGSRDGIRVDQTVTSGRGLVGRTVRVGPTTTTVALLTDPTFSVGARLNRSPRSFGIATGQGGRRMGFELVELSEGSRLSVGDALVTAGSDTFAPGVPVGQVTSVDTAASGTVRTAVVAPFADLADLDLLQVITEGPRATPRVPIPPVAPTTTPAPVRPRPTPSK